MNPARRPSPGTGRAPFAAVATVLAGLVGCGPVTPPPAAPVAPGPVADAGPAEAAPLFPAQNRPDVRGTLGAVSSDHPLATAVGLDVLRRGGTATDAVVAMAGVLAVVRPHMNGVGGDAFALFYEGASGRVTALNGSGRAGALATPELFEERGRSSVPSTGALSVSVPGAVAAWADALERYGTMPLSELLEPAIRYARGGFPVSSRLRLDIDEQSGALNEAGRALYLPGGEAPPAGALLANPGLARTLETIAARGKDGFYRGPVAERLAAFLAEEGGHLTLDDFHAHTSTWEEPIGVDYLGHRFLALGPNTQGFAQLQQMEMAKSFPLNEMGLNSADYLHTVVEITKLAQADLDRWLGDPAKADVPTARLLDPEYLRGRAALVRPGRAMDEPASGIGPALRADDGRQAGAPPEDPNAGSGDTVYLTAVDRFGNAVSWIQSLYNGFGSGLVEPSTGVLLHNRGALFVLDEGHPNRIAPGKRPYHTLTPLLALREGGRLAFTLGTPGGGGQTQTLLQVVHALLLFGHTPQEAVEVPRYRNGSGFTVSLEDRIPPGVVRALEARGHEVRLIPGWTATFGGAQMIWVDPLTGTLAAAADPRREAYALAY